MRRDGRLASLASTRCRGWRSSGWRRSVRWRCSGVVRRCGRGERRIANRLSPALPWARRTSPHITRSVLPRWSALRSQIYLVIGSDGSAINDHHFLLSDRTDMIALCWRQRCEASYAGDVKHPGLEFVYCARPRNRPQLTAQILILHGPRVVIDCCASLRSASAVLIARTSTTLSLTVRCCDSLPLGQYRRVGDAGLSCRRRCQLTPPR